MIRTNNMMAAALAVMLSGPALAAVTAEEANQLGSTLTTWGAEKAGNKEGTIPAYTGPLAVPASYDPKKPNIRPDPFADEKPLFSITAQNMDKYADRLSEGQKAMLTKYSTFRIDVYPTHRTVNYPKYFQENTLKNATICKTGANELTLVGCYGGMPFPIPKSGNEVMWNHSTQFETFSWWGNYTAWFVDASGRPILQGTNSGGQEQPFYDPRITGPVPIDVPYWRLRIDTSAPARKAGEKLLIVDSLDMLNVGRRVWQYLPGQRRVKLSPDLSYDTPNPQAGGAGTMDEAQVFLGPLDRYDFKMAGKKEMYIPYNAFKVGLCSNEKFFTPHHENPDCMRWELHRVWVVTAKLKPGMRHIYPTRTFFWDEDAPGAGMGDNYDASGKVYRVEFGITYPMYEAQAFSKDEFYGHDLAAGTYQGAGRTGDGGGWWPVPQKPGNYFSAEAMAGEGTR